MPHRGTGVARDDLWLQLLFSAIVSLTISRSYIYTSRCVRVGVEANGLRSLDRRPDFITYPYGLQCFILCSNGSLLVCVPRELFVFLQRIKSTGTRRQAGSGMDEDSSTAYGQQFTEISCGGRVGFEPGADFILGG